MAGLTGHIKTYIEPLSLKPVMSPHSWHPIFAPLVIAATEICQKQATSLILRVAV